MESITIGDITIGVRASSISCKGHRANITKRARAVLVALTERPNERVALPALATRCGITENNLRVQIAHLRKALAQCESTVTICTRVTRIRAHRRSSHVRSSYELVVPESAGRLIRLGREDEIALRRALDVCKRAWPALAGRLGHIVSKFGSAQ